MSGLNRQTGRVLDVGSAQHLVQSIGDILTTPLGSRVGRRDYGSELADLVDQPLNPTTRMRIFAATAMALMAWEPRVRLKRVQLQASAAGIASILLDVVRTDQPARPAVALTIPLSSI